MCVASTVNCIFVCACMFEVRPGGVHQLALSCAGVYDLPKYACALFIIKYGSGCQCLHAVVCIIR